MNTPNHAHAHAHATVLIHVRNIAAVLVLLAGCPQPAPMDPPDGTSGDTSEPSDTLQATTSIDISASETGTPETTGGDTSASSSTSTGGGTDTSSTNTATSGIDTSESTSGTTSSDPSSASSDGTSSDETSSNPLCQPGPKDTFGPCGEDNACNGNVCLQTKSGTMCTPPCEACMGGNQCVEDLSSLGDDVFLCTQSGNVSMCSIPCVFLNPDVSTCQGGAVCDLDAGVCVWPPLDP